MAQDEPPDEATVDDTHPLFLTLVVIQPPKDGLLPVAREGTMGGTPAHEVTPAAPEKKPKRKRTA